MKKSGTIEHIRNYPSPTDKVKMKEVVYWSNGLRVKGLFAMPIAQKDARAMLYLRGGLQFVGMVRAARIAQFAQQGFAVFAPYYRGNRGGEGRDEFAGDDRYDAVYAVDVLKKLADVENVHVYGFSRGGVMALWTAIIRNDIASVVTWAGVSDVTNIYWERLDMRRALKRIIGGTPNKMTDSYHERTPLFSLHNINAPVLIIHGTADEHVPIAHAYLLERSMRLLGKRVETWYTEAYTHHYPPADNRQTVRNLCHWMKKASSRTR